MEHYLSLSEAKMKLNRVVDAVQTRDDEFVITKNGKPAAVIIPSSLYEGWKETQEIMADKEFYREIKRGIKWLKSGKKKRFSFEDVFGEPLHPRK